MLSFKRQEKIKRDSGWETQRHLMKYTLTGEAALWCITYGNKGLYISGYNQEWGWGGAVSGSITVTHHGLKAPDCKGTNPSGHIPE